MISKSKIKMIAPTGTWNSNKDGMLMYRFSYTMEDGAVLSASHQSEGRFKIGDEVEYEVKGTNPSHGAYGAVKKPGSEGGYSSGGGNSRVRDRSFALSYAKDLAIAHISNNKEFTAIQITEVAEVFFKWLEE